MGTTPKRQLPYPEDPDSPNVPRDIKALAMALDNPDTPRAADMRIIEGEYTNAWEPFRTNAGTTSGWTDFPNPQHSGANVRWEFTAPEDGVLHLIGYFTIGYLGGYTTPMALDFTLWYNIISGGAGHFSTGHAYSRLWSGGHTNDATEGFDDTYFASRSCYMPKGMRVSPTWKFRGTTRYNGKPKYKWYRISGLWIPGSAKKQTPTNYAGAAIGQANLEASPIEPFAMESVSTTMPSILVAESQIRFGPNGEWRTGYFNDEYRVQRGGHVAMRINPAGDLISFPAQLIPPVPDAAARVPRLARKPDPTTGDLGLPAYAGSDTGWRAIAGLNNGWTADWFRWRRVGNQVHLMVRDLDGSAATAPEVDRMPAGFAPTGAQHYITPRNSSGTSGIVSLGASTAAVVCFDSGDGLPTGALRTEIVWSTTQNWPTSLPGTQITPPARWK